MEETAQEIVALLIEQPELAEQYDLALLSGFNWTEILCKCPELAKYCKWDKLQEISWIYLLQKQPQFVEKCVVDKLSSHAWEYLKLSQEKLDKYLNQSQKETIAKIKYNSQNVQEKPIITENSSSSYNENKTYQSQKNSFILPPITMLSKEVGAQGEDRESIIRCRKILQDTLDSFKVGGIVSGYISGPRFTQYEISLEAGFYVKKLKELSDNIAMNLSVKSIRILPVPGRSVIGVEIPNSKPEMVSMRSILESDLWQNTQAEIPIVLGKNVVGNPVILDLAKAPHLLIAGSTGSGKSVCINTLITSLIFNFYPEQLKLILVDLNIVEFENYKHLPHLITPVINDFKKVPVALKWVVNEIEKRYQILACAGAKKLSEFNSRTITGFQFDCNGMPIPDKIPILIIIIDEIADLMITEEKKDAETSITRITQKGRAVGVHIVVATQRPSSDVIAGIIKAKLSTRIAFKVGQRIDSQIVLGQNGAETLLGTGDMLYMASESSDIERVQGALVKDEDIKKVVHFVSEQAPQHFNSGVITEQTEDNNEENTPAYSYEDDLENDDFRMEEFGHLIRKYIKSGDSPNLRRALEVIVTDRKVSTSYLQRRLKIGYNQATELIELLEERGVIGPQTSGGGKREVLIDFGEHE